jgi:hypothetical protein
MSTLEAAPILSVESYPGIDPATVLNEELMSCNAEAEAAEQQLVRDFVTERVGVAPTPAAAETLTAAGGILEWQLFGKPGDPLPLGLIKVTDRKMQGTKIEMNPQYGVGFYSLLREWSSAGLDTIVATRNARRAAQYETLHQSAVKIFASTPLGKRLYSFAEKFPHYARRTATAGIYGCRPGCTRKTDAGSAVRCPAAAKCRER